MAHPKHRMVIANGDCDSLSDNAAAHEQIHNYKSFRIVATGPFASYSPYGMPMKKIQTFLIFSLCAIIVITFSIESVYLNDTSKVFRYGMIASF